MTAALKTCGGCGNSFEARGRAAYCSRACRQRAWRDRTGGNRNETLRGGVTKAAERRAGHCAEALEVLAALDAELADAARQSGQLLGWTAAESAVRELIARTIDRTTDLQQLYQDSDAKTRVKLSAELRLLEASTARLLKQVKTKLPEPTSLRTQKAQNAAHARWDRDGA
jgi:hypothetical protein